MLKPTFFIGMIFMLISIACFVYIAFANKKYYDTGEKPDRSKISILGGISIFCLSIGVILMLIF